ncbi:MAG: homoserine dehydrogenase [Spirochaetes bacterium]|nr:homoserine dehydrogenase [Spirochaetota bacterium]
MIKVNIGLIGFGTVGSGVYSLLKKNSALIKDRSGIDIRIRCICDIRADELGKKIKNTAITKDWKEIISDPEIDTVVELIGGLNPAKSIVTEALRKGKNVVTANKKLLAEEGDAIFDTQKNSIANLFYEASVCGGIPCIQALRDGLVGNRVDLIMGILNGTTNFILTKMEDDGLSFAEALKFAQQKGFAEADPTFDIEGFDAAHKLAVVSRMAFNKKINFKTIPIEGITGISRDDIIYAREMGYAIKLLGVSRLTGDKVEISVAPTMLPLKHPLASVHNEFNAIMFSGDMTGPIILYGKGAGSLPTASAVVSDIVQIAQKGKSSGIAAKATVTAKLLESKDKMHRYYMRLSTLDSPGILSKISGVLAKSDISIASVMQKAENSKYVPVIIMTHKCSEKGMLQSVNIINSFDFMERGITFIRIEE